MLILLPPSETKTRPDTSREDGAAGLSGLPGLDAARATMRRAVQRTAAHADAATMLQVPASAPELVERMAQLEHEPVGAPLEVYSGVLYDQLDPAVVSAGDSAGDPRVLIQSALFGLVDAGADRIPAYRLSAGSTLSRLGRAGSWWVPHLKPVAAELLREQARSSSPLVIDCRSGSYRSMMRLRSTEQVRVLEVAPVQEREGRRTVVSHDAKRYRGLVTRALLAAPALPATAQDLVPLLQTALGSGLAVELDGDRLAIVDRLS